MNWIESWLQRRRVEKILIFPRKTIQSEAVFSFYVLKPYMTDIEMMRISPLLPFRTCFLRPSNYISTAAVGSNRWNITVKSLTIKSQLWWLVPDGVVLERNTSLWKIRYGFFQPLYCPHVRHNIIKEIILIISTVLGGNKQQSCHFSVFFGRKSNRYLFQFWPFIKMWPLIAKKNATFIHLKND